MVLLHALFALVLWYEMQHKSPHPAVARADIDQALVIHLIDHSSKPRIAPPPEPIPPPKSAPPPPAETARVRPVAPPKPPRATPVEPDHPAPPAPVVASAPPPAVSGFVKGGLVQLPPTTQPAYASTVAKAASDQPADDRRIMQHNDNPLHYKATRFDKYFPPANETAGGAVSRHVGDAIQGIAKSICDPKRHGFNPLCGSPPIPPSPKDGDARLSLPPAPLADNPHAAAPPPLSTCIAEYKDTKPLSYGCPANTPDLAFKAEMRECIDLFRAGKRLKTWCPVDTPKRAAAESAAPAAASSGDSH